MEFHTAKQISPSILQNINYDLFILAAGYEQRSIFLPSMYSIKADLKIALAFLEKPKELSRRGNDSYLAQHGFTFLSISGEESSELKPFFSDFFQKKQKEHLYVLIDYSSMTKVWYSALVNFLISFTKSCNYVTIHFSYTPASYNEPKKSTTLNINNLTVFPCKKPSDSQKPIALLIGLGLDKNRAEYIRKTINPALTILLYADPTNDVSYVDKVFKNNRDLIEETEVRNLFNYPLTDLEKTDEILTNLCLNLRVRYNIFIAPVGPKVLSLLALLLASRYPDINVMRVSTGNNAAYERVPLGEPLIYSVEFVSDDLES